MVSRLQHALDLVVIDAGFVALQIHVQQRLLVRLNLLTYALAAGPFLALQVKNKACFAFLRVRNGLVKA